MLYDGRLPNEAELEGIRSALKNELFAAEAAMDLMDFHSPEIHELLCNILYLGMPKRIEQIKHGDNNAEDAEPHKKRKASHKQSR